VQKFFVFSVGSFVLLIASLLSPASAYAASIKGNFDINVFGTKQGSAMFNVDISTKEGSGTIQQGDDKINIVIKNAKFDEDGNLTEFEFGFNDDDGNYMKDGNFNLTTKKGNSKFIDDQDGFLKGNFKAKNLNTTKVPEPLTILGSATALGFGALLKREHSKKQKES